jgi:hypothetical protein
MIIVATCNCSYILFEVIWNRICNVIQGIQIIRSLRAFLAVWRAGKKTVAGFIKSLKSGSHQIR